MKKRARNKKLAGGKLSRAGKKARDSSDWSAPDEELYRPIKRPVTLRLDADILSWFKAQGRGYQTRINRALRGVMMKER